MKSDPEVDSSSGEEEEDELDEVGDLLPGRQPPSLPSLSSSVGDPANPASGPAQKRRRVTRACDECRRKKIKCDGKQPCTHCTVYSYECTYDQPSNRRRNPAPAYVEGLEGRLQKAQIILNSIAPGIDLTDPKFDSQTIDQIIAGSRSSQPDNPPDSSRAQEDDHQMQTIVEATGQLDLDDQGNLDYHGNSSSFVFMRNLRSQFGALSVPDPRIPAPERSTFSELVGSPTSTTSSRFDQSADQSSELPDRETAIQLCKNALDIACALMGFVHKPKFYSRLDQLYDTAPDNYTNSNIQFLPLLYMAMAVGCLFTPSNDSQPSSQHQGAVQQGYIYFQTARGMLNIPDCRNLITLQAIIFKIMFLQSSARLSTCYSYIGIAQRTCCRLGMHRDLNHDFDLIEREERKRAFWLIRALDAYVSALLGLPQLLSEDDVDQPLPLEVGDEFITPTNILPTPAGQVKSVGPSSHAQIQLMFILQKVVRYVYPVKSGKPESQARWSISQLKIREIETDLQRWMDALPIEFKPDDNAPTETARVQRLLRFSYAHIQMMLYRPFLHFVSQRAQSENLDRRSYACAAACVSVTRNIVHIAAEMRRKQLLSGSQWFIVYTTYLAVVSLVYFVFENPNSASARDIMKDAAEGKRLLAKLAKESAAAERCYHSLAAVFIELPAKLQERKANIKPGPASRKRANEREAATPESSSSRPPSQGEGPSRALRDGGPTGTARSRRSKQNSTTKRKDTKTSPVRPVEQMTPTTASSVAASDDGRGSRYGEDAAYRPVTSTSASFPDLRGLMYPSENPFAYGNQPLSTLEDNQALHIVSRPQEPMHIDPSSERAAMGYSSGHFHQPAFIAPPQDQPWQNPDGLLGGRAEDMNAYTMPARPPGADPGMSGNQTFWQQLARGPPGLTPGVGMEDVFGTDGWNTMYPNPDYRRFGQQ